MRRTPFSCDIGPWSDGALRSVSTRGRDVTGASCAHVQGTSVETSGSTTLKKPVRSLALLSAAALAAGRASPAPLPPRRRQVGEPQILAKDLAGPLSTAVAPDGTAYVTANFGGKLLQDRRPTDASGGLPEDRGGRRGRRRLGRRRPGGLRALRRQAAGEADRRRRQGPRRSPTSGATRSNKNPDKKAHLRVPGHQQGVRGQAAQTAGPAQYTGVVDSHPYATEHRGRDVYLADAGGNDILSIADDG